MQHACIHVTDPTTLKLPHACGVAFPITLPPLLQGFKKAVKAPTGAPDLFGCPKVKAPTGAQKATRVDRAIDQFSLIESVQRFSVQIDKTSNFVDLLDGQQYSK